MDYGSYNELLCPSSLDNFQESLNYSNGNTFNSLLNIFVEEKVEYKVIQGFNYTAKDKDIKKFNKISFEFKDSKEIENIIKSYELEGIFEIKKEKKVYTFNIK